MMPLLLGSATPTTIARNQLLERLLPVAQRRRVRIVAGAYIRARLAGRTGGEVTWNDVMRNQEER